jgi:hypothetical protein
MKNINISGNIMSFKILYFFSREWIKRFKDPEKNKEFKRIGYILFFSILIILLIYDLFLLNQILN